MEEVSSLETELARERESLEDLRLKVIETHRLWRHLDGRLGEQYRKVRGLEQRLLALQEPVS